MSKCWSGDEWDYLYDFYISRQCLSFHVKLDEFNWYTIYASVSMEKVA